MVHAHASVIQAAFDAIVFHERTMRVLNHRIGPGKPNSVIAVLQRNVRVQKTTGRIDGAVHEVAIHRGMDKRTAYACERPDPSMGKAEWWAVKTGRKQVRRAA